MDTNSNKTEAFYKNWSEFNSVSHENNNTTMDNEDMNDGMFFPMILDKKNKSRTISTENKDYEPFPSNNLSKRDVRTASRNSISSNSILSDINSSNCNFGEDNSEEGTLDSLNNDENPDFDETVERMITAETPPDPFISIQTRTLLRWVEDSNAPKCSNCKASFRMLLRRHHCIAENTPVTMMNGMARKIQSFKINTRLPAWDQVKNNLNIVDGSNNAVLDQGREPCMEIILEDGRNLIATSDHEILVVPKGEIVPRYVMMKDLTPNHQVVCSFLNGVLDEPELDQNEYIIPGPGLSILQNRDECLAFARLCGYSLTDGSIDHNSNRIVFVMGDLDDVESICQDIELLISEKIKRPNLEYTGVATVYRIEFSNAKLKTWFEDAGVTIGNRVNQGMKIPHFMWDETCPRSIQREFIAGWFGGDGSRIDVTANGKSLKTNYHTVSVNLQGPDAMDVLNNATANVDRMNSVIKSFGIDSEVIVTSTVATIPKLTTLNGSSPQQLRVTKDVDGKMKVTYDTTSSILHILSYQDKLCQEEIYDKMSEILSEEGESSTKFKSTLTKLLQQTLLFRYDDKILEYKSDGKLYSREIPMRYSITELGLERLKYVDERISQANNPHSGVIPRITCRIGFNINLENMVKFNKMIGFRHCIEKQIKMSVTTAYEDYRKRIAMQRVKLIHVALDSFFVNNPKYVDPRTKDSSFKQSFPKKNECEIALNNAYTYGIANNFDPSILISTQYKGFDKLVSGDRRTYEGNVGKILASSPILSFDQYLLNIGYNWEEQSRNGNRYFKLKILYPPKLYKDGEPVRVYDLSVPTFVSFVANGMVVHNCRSCGGVFCGTCSNNWNTIPECITHIPSSDGLKADIDRTVKVRLCDKCNEKIVLVKKLEILLKSTQSIEMDIFAFKAITEQRGDEMTDSFIQKVNQIQEIDKMDDSDVIKFTQSFMNGKLWMQLANFYLSKFREIQYKLLYQEYTEWEKNALWTNYKYLKNHDIWMGHVLRSFVDDTVRLSTVIEYYFQDEYSEISFNDTVVKDRDACWERMCTRLCQPRLSWETSLMILDIIVNKNGRGGGTNNISDNIRDKITKQIVESWKHCSDNIFYNLLPIITYRLIYDDGNEILIDFLMYKCSDSLRVANRVYWAFMLERPDNAMRCDYLISRLFRSISKDIYNKIVRINNFVRTVEENYQGDINPNFPIRDLDKLGKCISPTHPEFGEQIVTNTILPGEKSANRPVPIVLSSLDGKDKNVELYKREDLRTDMIVMSVINIMHEIVKDTMDIDLHIVTYEIQPVSKNTGFIGAVKDCDTLYTIEETMKISLSNYIKKYNPDTPAKILHERFLRSCAFYSVVTFLLGIGDRHLDNIMLTKKGEFFHIDYGFVLGKDPRPMKTPHMRITAGMADAIGGYHSEEYKEFKNLCYEIYDILRRHVNTFVAFLSLLPKQDTGGTWTNPKISDNRVLREIVKRFAPGGTSEQARNILDTKIEKSTNMTSTGKGYVIDFFHRHNKEGTVGNLFSYTVGSTYNGTKSLMSGIWNYVSGSEN
jgi:hypothetical protein